MSPEISDVERALLALAPHDRATVIHSGLLSLDERDDLKVDQETHDEGWQVEFRRRIDEIEDGTVELVSGKESSALVRDLLAVLHR